MHHRVHPVSRDPSPEKPGPLFPSISLANLSAKMPSTEHTTGRSPKYTAAGTKLHADSGLVFRTQLKDKEYVYLNASEFGELEVVQDLLSDPQLDRNCVDYMGRNAMLLAVKNENIDMVDLLVRNLDFYAIEDALLHAISQAKNHLVKMIVDHPQYIRLEKQVKLAGRRKQSLKETYGKRSQFSSDISPLMLAAHTNNHEIIQLLLDRGVKLEMPHDRGCICSDCETIRAEDSLILELQRLHTYQALSSSAYLALTTSDPISAAFVLRDELYQLASQEKQFKEEYSNLAVQCMDFAVSCLDLCRTSDEVQCLLRGDSDQDMYQQQKHPLDTVKIAIRSREKKFVAHSNCQHQLENLFYNPMFCIRDFEGVQRLHFFLIFLPLLPILYLLYLFFPKFRLPLPEALIHRDRAGQKYEIGNILRCPVVKFLGYMTSYFIFLILITVATFRLDRTEYNDVHDGWRKRASEVWSYDFRSSTVVMTKIQIILLFWILGQLAMGCKQVYHYGLRYFFRSNYNIMDWASIALYLACYSLRIIVDVKVLNAAFGHRDQLRTAHSLWDNATCSSLGSCFQVTVIPVEDYVQYRNEILMPLSAYWLRGCRLWWAPDDPEYVSDCLFALGNVLSFARISHLMPAWELLGPLQISLARMITDIIRFMALFSVIVIAFVVGLTNLYWYFANIIVSVDLPGRKVGHVSGIPAFKSTGATFYTLYWALFGQSSNNVTTIDEDLASQYPGHMALAVQDSPKMISSLGSVLYAIYNACMIIILLNMLIAMMSKSFDEIQGDRLEEWKFARATLWMVYIEQEGVLPPPLNLLPSREALTAFYLRMKSLATRKPLKSETVESKLNNIYSSGVDQWSAPRQHIDRSHMIKTKNMRKTITTTTVSTVVDDLPDSASWDSSDEDPDGKVLGLRDQSMDEFKQFTDATRSNVLRRFLFLLQKQKEDESNAAELSMMNYQRNQALKAIENDVKRKSDLIREGEAKIGDDTQSITHTEPDHEEDNRLRGFSHLLMPPSIRRKLEADASFGTGGPEFNGRATAEAVARYYLLETTKPELCKMPHVSTWKPALEDQFTARTERPVKGAHLRELYQVEREMHDMSEALSSQSFSEATISEINELEQI